MSEYTGNKIGGSTLFDVLLTLKQNVMRDTNVAEICKVLEVKSDATYVVAPLNNSKQKLFCQTYNGSKVNVNDIVLVIFTNTDNRLNLNKVNNKQTTQSLNSVNLHSSEYGIIIGGSNIGTSSTVVELKGSTERPKYNDKDLALFSDIPTNYVTTDTIQNISGQKSFSLRPTYKSSTFMTYDDTTTRLSQEISAQQVSGNMILSGGVTGEIATTFTITKIANVGFISCSFEERLVTTCAVKTWVKFQWLIPNSVFEGRLNNTSHASMTAFSIHSSSGSPGNDWTNSDSLDSFASSKIDAGVKVSFRFKKYYNEVDNKFWHLMFVLW